MSKNRMKHCLDELEAFADDGIQIIPEIVRSDETQCWISDFFARFNLDRTNPDHVDHVLCILSEHAVRDWPAGNKASDSEIFATLAKIDAHLQRDSSSTLSLIAEAIVVEPEAADGTDASERDQGKPGDREKRLSKEKKALRIKAKRYYEQALVRELDLSPKHSQELPGMLDRLAKIMETRRYERTIRSSPRAGAR
jgi:hypothetical protein